MTTRAEAKNKRILELTNIAKRVTEYTLAPEMDEDARGLYWIGPWDFKRWARDEKGNYKKDDSGDHYHESVRDPLPAIHIHLGAFKPRPSALKIAPAHRCIGYLEDRKLLFDRIRFAVYFHLVEAEPLSVLKNMQVDGVTAKFFMPVPVREACG